MNWFKSKHAILILLIHLSFTVSAENDWILAKEKDGVTVYTKESASSPVKSFKAITTIDVSVGQLLEAILDVDQYAQWYDHCKKSEDIGQKPEGDKSYYMELSMPFPFSNRDMAGDLRVKAIEGGYHIKISKRSFPTKDGIVRMPVSQGSWTLKCLNGQSTLVEHQFEGDPAGNIPAGIVNMFLVGGPINTLSSLRDYVKGGDK